MYFIRFTTCKLLCTIFTIFLLQVNHRQFVSKIFDAGEFHPEEIKRYIIF